MLWLAIMSLVGVVLNWSTENLAGNQVHHITTCDQTTESGIKSSALEVADYALSLLGESINDDSLYCLFEWDDEQSQLTIVVTDHSKSNDGKHIVTIQFNGLNQASFEEKVEALKFWLRDHLTTSGDYLKFSLVAGFTRNKRETIELM